MALPRVNGRPWYVKDTWSSVIGFGVGVVASVAALSKEGASARPNGFQMAVLSVVFMSVGFLGLVRIAQSRFKDAQDDKKTTPDDLRGCLLVIHRMIAGHKGSANPPEGWLRVTIHRVDGDDLEQSVEYVGSGDRKKAGRRFRINTGLVGVVARNGQVRAFDRARDMPFGEWCEYLVEHHGMMPAAARSTREDRFAFLGVPIKSPGGGEVRAVLYFDAADPYFFDKDTVNLAVCGGEGLASWVDERYYSKG